MIRPSVAALALCAATALGACDGGLFGTGGDDDAGAIGTGDLGASPSSVGPGLDVDGNGAAIEASDSLPEAASVFVNDRPTLEGTAPLLRVVNVSAGAVRVAAGGEVSSVEGGEIGEIAVLDPQTASLEVSEARSSRTVEQIRVRLASGTLTTLIVFREPSGTLAAMPLLTNAAAPIGGVAEVRVVVPGATGDPFPGLELRPAGTDPGGAAAAFTFAGPIASAYEIVTPGDYALIGADGGTSATLSLEAGRVHTLVLGAPGALPLLVVDSDIASGAR